MWLLLLVVLHALLMNPFATELCSAIAPSICDSVPLSCSPSVSFATKIPWWRCQGTLLSLQTPLSGWAPRHAL